MQDYMACSFTLIDKQAIQTKMQENVSEIIARHNAYKFIYEL